MGQAMLEWERKKVAESEERWAVILERAAKALFEEFYRPAPELADVVDDTAWDEVPDAVHEKWRERAQAVLNSLDLTPEWGIDVKGRKKPNPRLVFNHKGRPETECPEQVVEGWNLYTTYRLPWVKVEQGS